ncbi:DUF4397 domain-containing protein [Metabacillus iocasae]|uniref:DUF4397 domain-containing protein n=1 Tax=Priestia iocasae TaxID=2291674 RepID=A0ABS2QWV0_9BACI|nr:DUF4397 domain-containing protein [Metabacillus iocasae]MBM7703892.1 hypothetical protein [Metabacillus iocasae]
MKIKRYLMTITAIVMMVCSSQLAFAAETPSPNPDASAKEAKVRIVHASPDAPAVDVFVDGTAAVEGAKFKDATEYLTVPAGERKVEIFAAGTKGQKDPVITASLVVEGDKSYTVAAINTLDKLELKVLTNETTAPNGKAKVRVGHFSPDAPAVNVGPKGGKPLFSNLKFKDVSAYAELPAGSYDLAVTTVDGNKEVLALPGTKVEAGKTYTVLAINKAQNLEPLVLVDSE